jgi:hypothetical protein
VLRWINARRDERNFRFTVRISSVRDLWIALGQCRLFARQVLFRNRTTVSARLTVFVSGNLQRTRKPFSRRKTIARISDRLSKRRRTRIRKRNDAWRRRRTPNGAETGSRSVEPPSMSASIPSSGRRRGVGATGEETEKKKVKCNERCCGVGNRRDEREGWNRARTKVHRRDRVRLYLYVRAADEHGRENPAERRPTRVADRSIWLDGIHPQLVPCPTCPRKRGRTFHGCMCTVSAYKG